MRIRSRFFSRNSLSWESAPFFSIIAPSSGYVALWTCSTIFLSASSNSSTVSIGLLCAWTSLFPRSFTDRFWNTLIGHATTLRSFSHDGYCWNKELQNSSSTVIVLTKSFSFFTPSVFWSRPFSKSVGWDNHSSSLFHRNSGHLVYRSNFWDS